jgi:hypothetical protein
MDVIIVLGSNDVSMLGVAVRVKLQLATWGMMQRLCWGELSLCEGCLKIVYTYIDYFLLVFCSDCV